MKRDLGVRQLGPQELDIVAMVPADYEVCRHRDRSERDSLPPGKSRLSCQVRAPRPCLDRHSA